MDKLSALNSAKLKRNLMESRLFHDRNTLYKAYDLA
jgi:hypothetical protein